MSKKKKPRAREGGGEKNLLFEERTEEVRWSWVIGKVGRLDGRFSGE